LNLLAAVFPIDNPYGRRILLILLAIAAVGQTFADFMEGPEIERMSLAIWTLVAFLAAILALRFALRATAVKGEQIYAALSAYVLAGLFFGVLYWIVEHTWPGSLGVGGESTYSDFSPVSGMYFSFVTLATLGYGDIVPRSDVARGIAIVEAVIGQLYLAVMVARLVSMYVVKGRER
jgi:hypothetical protein